MLTKTQKTTNFCMVAYRRIQSNKISLLFHLLLVKSSVAPRRKKSVTPLNKKKFESFQTHLQKNIDVSSVYGVYNYSGHRSIETDKARS
jgi:hypothetical protein